MRTWQPESLSEREIDAIVEAQAADESWEQPIRVRKKKSASVYIPAELAARVAFLAQLHREQNTEDLGDADNQRASRAGRSCFPRSQAWNVHKKWC